MHKFRYVGRARITAPIDFSMWHDSHMPMPWFSTKGQIAQLCFTAVACVFSGVKAWPDMLENKLLSLGAILFYLLVGLVSVSVYRLQSTIRKHGQSSGADNTSAAASYHEARSDLFRKQAESLQKEVDRLRSEIGNLKSKLRKRKP